METLERKESLALFKELQKRKGPLNVPQKPPTSRAVASLMPAQMEAEDDLLKVDVEKSDCDWLLTPPSTPQNGAELAHSRASFQLQSLAALKISKVSSSEAFLKLAKELQPSAVSGRLIVPSTARTNVSTRSTSPMIVPIRLLPHQNAASSTAIQAGRSSSVGKVNSFLSRVTSGSRGSSPTARARAPEPCRTLVFDAGPLNLRTTTQECSSSNSRGLSVGRRRDRSTSNPRGGGGASSVTRLERSTSNSRGSLTGEKKERLASNSRGLTMGSKPERSASNSRGSSVGDRFEHLTSNSRCLSSRTGGCSAFRISPSDVEDGDIRLKRWPCSPSMARDRSNFDDSSMLQSGKVQSGIFLPVLTRGKMVEKVMQARKAASLLASDQSSSMVKSLGQRPSIIKNSSATTNSSKDPGSGKHILKTSLDGTLQEMDNGRTTNTLHSLMANVPMSSSIYATLTLSSHSPIATSSNASSELGINIQRDVNLNGSIKAGGRSEKCSKASPSHPDSVFSLLKDIDSSTWLGSPADDGFEWIGNFKQGIENYSGSESPLVCRHSEASDCAHCQLGL